MKTNLLFSTLAATAVSAALASPALAVSMVAGWDFSQFAVDGGLSVDGENLTNTADSNYSDLDPTFGAGAESAAFGTMYLNGQFGSTNTPLDFTDPFVPSAAAPNSLASNLTAPAGSDFDSSVVLGTEGQSFFNLFTMTALSAATVVFEADLTSVPEIGSDWSVSFGGKTNTGASLVTIEFSTNGVDFTSFGTVNLTAVDTPFSVVLGASSADKAYVRLGFNPGAGQQTFLDNLAINANLATVPEPATAALLLVGLAGLARIGRRRA